MTGMRKNIPEARQPYRDPFLLQGLLVAPAAAFADALAPALLIAFSYVCFLLAVVPLSLLIPKRVPFPVRILLYSVLGGLVYIPVALGCMFLFPDVTPGLYLPLLPMMPVLTFAHDRYFAEKGAMRNLLRMTVSAPPVLIGFGIVREMLGSGTLSGRTLLQKPPLPVLTTPAGGLLLLTLVMIAAAVLTGENRKETADADS